MNKEYLETAILAAQQGGRILRDYFDKVHDARQKNENARDIVTEVDILAEKTICETIATAFPDHEIIGEETQSSPQGNRNRWFITFQIQAKLLLLHQKLILIHCLVPIRL